MSLSEAAILQAIIAVGVAVGATCPRAYAEEVAVRLPVGIMMGSR